jgi:hypothetical protein
MMSSVSTQSTTAAAASTSIKRLFAAIESKFGGLSSLMDAGSRAEVIVNEEGAIESHELERLLSNEATALHIKGFYNREGTYLVIVCILLFWCVYMCMC